MGKKVSEIYTEYKIMPSLQLHMLRVAAVASLICDSFNEPLPKEDIITACLFHDMGNIIKSNLNIFPDFLEREGLEYWKQVKDEYIEKYGLDEHIATEDISKEIGLSEKVVTYIKNLGFSHSSKNESENIFEHKICNYSDMRVGPYEIMPMEERILEGHKRYQGRKHTISSDNFEPLAQSVRNIEKQIFSKCLIKPEDITNEKVAPIISKLKNFVVK